MMELEEQSVRARRSVRNKKRSQSLTLFLPRTPCPLKDTSRGFVTMYYFPQIGMSGLHTRFTAWQPAHHR
jgi:hypothetical protein